MTRKRKTRVATGPLLTAASACGLGLGDARYVVAGTTGALATVARKHGSTLELESARIIAPSRVEVRDLAASRAERGVRAMAGVR